MPRGVSSERTNRSNAQRARYAKEKWLREKYTIYDRVTNEKFVPAEDELFVPLFHYKEDKDLKRYRNATPVWGKLDSKYLVSNKGHVISFKFHGTDEPILMHQTEKPDPNRNISYMVVGDAWNVHQLVWFSFAADAIENGYELPSTYGITTKELKTLGRLKKLKDFEIHHRDKNPQNNCLDNLECDSDRIHAFLHELDRLETESERLTEIRSYQFDNPTMIQLDGTLSISEIDADEFMRKADAALKEHQWTLLTAFVIKTVSQAIGDERFRKKDWYVCIDANGQKGFFIVKKAENVEGEQKVVWIDDFYKLQELGNKEMDIYCDIGGIYLMNYIDDADIADNN
jgi:hypothetical protein